MKPFINLLLIEKNIHLVQIIRQYLSLNEDFQYIVSDVKDLSDASQLSSPFSFNILVVSLDFFEENFTQTIKVLTEYFAGTPVILLLEKDEKELLRRLLPLGISEFLIKKEITQHVLTKTIQRQLECNELHLRLDQAIREQKKMGIQDVLTSLPNRRLLTDRLQHAVEDAKRYGYSLAVFCFDVVGFKAINNVYGHSVGDLLLKSIAERITQHIRNSDTIARYGNDEFVVVMTHLNNQYAINRIYNRIKDIFNKPFCLLGQQQIYVAANVGVSLYPADGRSSDILLSHAEIAMNQARDTGNHLVFYHPAVNDEVHEYLNMSHCLSDAIREGNLLLFYQPQIDLDTGKVFGVEALVRWRDPKWGLLMPQQFIPMAQEMGLLNVLSEWVVRTACKQLSVWQKQGIENLKLSFNLLATQLCEPGFIDNILAILEETHVKHSSLIFEVTEQSFLQDMDTTTEVLKYLKEVGFGVTIDDFATGNYLLNYLRELPIDTINIDRILTRDLTNNAGGKEMLESIFSFAKQLNMKVVSEGIDSMEKQQFMREMGCHLMQGYLYSPPLSANDCASYLRTHGVS
jgi:diguanylate cyclase (GGDEF)-like protein